MTTDAKFLVKSCHSDISICILYGSFKGMVCTFCCACWLCLL